MPLATPVVILANGAFPSHPVPLKILERAQTLIACDGAANHLQKSGPMPSFVIGDLDSLEKAASGKYKDILVSLPSQDSTDLEKAIRWAVNEGAGPLTIIGTAGMRDDHAFANYMLLWTDFGSPVTIVTDHGIFHRVADAISLPSFEGQHIGLFPASADIRITSTGLVYNLEDRTLIAMHRGSANLSASDLITLSTIGGPLLVFQSHAP